MKKSLLALAVLGATTGAAWAQSNVTIYGLVDAGFNHTKVSAGGESESVTGLESGQQSGSRLGFKGSEDLGGGLSAIFTLENGFLVDTGNFDQQGQLFGRQAWVGLNGNFGAVKLGRQYTPLFGAVDSIDPFETGLGTLNAGALMTFDVGGLRMDNTITYSLPSNLGGFYGQVAYGFGEEPGDTSANRALGASIGYGNGPVRAVLAYHNRKDDTGDTLGRTMFVGGTYDFQVAKIHAAFADNKGAASLGTVLGGVLEDLGADLTGLDTKSRDYMIGASAPVGSAGKVLASYMRKDFRDLPPGFDVESDVWALGYTHNLSKRTNLYTSVGRATFEDTGDEAKITTFNVGIRHIF